MGVSQTLGMAMKSWLTMASCVHPDNFYAYSVYHPSASSNPVLVVIVHIGETQLLI